MNHDEAIRRIDGITIARRKSWPSHYYLHLIGTEVHKKKGTTDDVYEPTPEDQAATDWEKVDPEIEYLMDRT